MMIRRSCEDASRLGTYRYLQQIRIRGASLSPRGLRRAIAAMVKRHPALRTCFWEDDRGLIWQLLQSEASLGFRDRDLRHLDPDQQVSVIDGAAEEMKLRFGSLQTLFNPPFYFHFFRLSDTDSELVMVVHHAVMDGWANIEFLKELFQKALTPESVVFKDLPLCNALKDLGALELGVGNSPVIQLHWDSEGAKMRIPVMTKIQPIAGEVLEHEFSSVLHVRLTQFALEHQVPLKIIYLMSFLDALCELFGTEVTVGIVTDGRAPVISGSLQALGQFWNMLPLTRRPRSEDLSEKIRQLHQQVLEMTLASRSQYPLSQLIQGSANEFVGSFNFIQFHHRPEDQQIDVYRFFDRYHYPLNLTVISEIGSTGSCKLKLDFDSSKIDESSAEKIFDATINHLCRLGEKC